MKRKNISILLIDDDVCYCKLVTAALKRAGHSTRFIVKTANALADGIKLTEADDFDLALLDLGLPDSFGLDTFDRFHAACPNLPTVLVTGLEDEKTSIEAIKRGASDFLVKGVDSFIDILVRTILYAIERTRAEQMLQLSERNFRNIINRSADAIIVTNKSGTILFANPAVEALFGWNSDELLGKPFEHPVTVGRTAEIELTRKSGAKAAAEMRTVETNWQGKTARLVSLRDITERRATERKMNKYRENLKTLVEERTEKVNVEKELLSVTFSSMGDGVIVVDPQKRIVLFNRVAEVLAGWEFEYVQDRKLDDIFRIADERTRERIVSPVDKVLKSIKTELGPDSEVLLAMDGSERPISTKAAPIIGADGAITGIVIVFRDVSREREIERLKQDFISSVSHELRTPLTSIKAYTETILNDPNMDEDTRKRFLEIIDEESNRLATLIEGLLEISRIESGTIQILREPMDVDVLAEQVVTALRPLADKKHIDLQSEIDENLLPFEGDADRIQSVLTNLVNNAIKFTPPRGSVKISVLKGSEQLIVSVCDTGMGIPKEALPRIFDRFYRVYHPGKHIQGTGLGLAIVKKIVTMHGGRIEVQSEIEKGTTFTIFLPLDRRNSAEESNSRIKTPCDADHSPPETG
ncbi:MAG: PAS domain S-box protein [Sedimentisphaerales bacterium]|nr:PAS domain S-box protein [Sedimentisphaerales bacterium]